MKLEKYRQKMTEEVLHSWAKDAQELIEHLENIISEAEGGISNIVNDRLKDYTDNQYGKRELKLIISKLKL